MNIPNGLSLLRLLLAPLFGWLLISHLLEWALLVFVLASLTDAADGYIAKKFDQETELGRYLDPLADKVLLVVGFITLTVIGLIPLWVTLMIVTRDVVLVGGGILARMLSGDLQIRPLMISKVNTVFQMILILLVLLTDHYASLQEILDLHIWATVASTLVSFVAYVSQWPFFGHGSSQTS